jgi:hypothetical protein
VSEQDKPVEDFRSWAREQWGVLGEQAGRVLATALEAKKPIRRYVTCSKCGNKERKEIQVGDAKIALDALHWLTESGFGRSPIASEGEDKTIIFVNVTRLVDADGEDTLSWLAGRGLLSRPLVEVEAEWSLEHTSPPDAAERYLHEITSNDD